MGTRRDYRTTYSLENGVLARTSYGVAFWEHRMGGWRSGIGGWADANAAVPPPAWVRGRFRCRIDFAHLGGRSRAC